MSIRIDYGQGSYGEGLYGGTPDAAHTSLRVGTDFQVALAGVGLQLVPGKKSYDKHAAQTFSYNPKSLFKQGDGAALVAKDLYYWSRLEHSKWDGGETYEPWAPDPTDSTKQSHKYSDSLGFDVTDPHRLTHLREVYVSPSFEFTVKSDNPLAYWLMADHESSSEMYDQISTDRTPGTYFGNVLRDIQPGPIVNDSNSVVGFDGSTGYSTTGLKTVPFPSNVTPTTAWSLEAWVNPPLLPPPTSEVIALIGNEVVGAGGSGYHAAVLADGATNTYRLDEASPGTNARSVIDSGSALQNIIAGDPRLLGAATGITSGASLIPSDADASYVFTANGNGGVFDLNAAPYHTTTFNNFSIEAWFKLTSITGDHMIIAMGDRPQGFMGSLLVNAASHLIWDVGQDTIRTDTGYVVSTGKTYHIVGTFSSTNVLNVYVNGTLIFGPVTITPTGREFGVAIGAVTNPGGGATWNAVGTIDEVAFYDGVVLTAAQVAAHYTASGTGTPAGGFAIGIGDGAGGSGSKFVAYLPGVGWVNSGYTLLTEGIGSTQWAVGGPGILSIGPGGIVLDTPLVGGASVSGVQGTWYHLAITYDGTSIRFYVNGVLQGTVAAVPLSAASYALMGSTGSTSTLGVVSAQSFWFKGLLSQVAVYSTTLTAARLLAHYNAGIGAASSAALTPGQTYARFVETYDGTLYINQKNTNVIYSTDGGASFSLLVMPGGDVTDFKAIWSKGTRVYAATATNTYIGANGSAFATFNGVNPALSGVTAGLYYSGQIYVGVGTSLNYVDPATGIKTQLYDTVDFTISFIEAFQGKIWFGGTNGRMTRLWTWTNNTLPPSAANGVGAQVQDGTLPYGFIARCSTVYLNTLLIGGTICGDTTTEGQGSVYYVTAAGLLGQLCVVGPAMRVVRGSGLDYGVRSMWGAINMLWMGYSYNSGIARYDFGPGAFSSHATIYNAKGALGRKVLAVTYFNGRAVFATDDGFVWKESTNKVNTAILSESEFHELPFLEKTIDGIEGRHSALLTGQRVLVDMSFDYGLTWLPMGENNTLGSTGFEFPLVGVHSGHWQSRVRSLRGSDATQSPEINNWSVRFAPQNTPKHEWLIDCFLPVVQRTQTGMVLTDAGNKLLAQLWASRENGVVVDFVDRDRVVYKVLVIEMHEGELNNSPVRVNAGQLQNAATLQVELLEVQRMG